MTRKTHVTRHATKRILKGDAKGLRTKLTIEELIAHLNHPSTFKIDGNFYIWSRVDEGPLFVVAAQGGKTIITVHDTSREPTRLAQLLLEAREGMTVSWKHYRLPLTYDERQTARITLGRAERERGGYGWECDVEVATLFDCTYDDLGFVETKWFHELIVEAVMNELKFGTYSPKRIKRWCIGVESPNFRGIRTSPIWVSFDILGLPHPS